MCWCDAGIVRLFAMLREIQELGCRKTVFLPWSGRRKQMGFSPRKLVNDRILRNRSSISCLFKRRTSSKSGYWRLERLRRKTRSVVCSLIFPRSLRAIQCQHGILALQSGATTSSRSRTWMRRLSLDWPTRDVTMTRLLRYPHFANYHPNACIGYWTISGPTRRSSCVRPWALLGRQRRQSSCC